MDWAKFKKEIHQALFYLRDFLLNPVKGVCSPPNWNWPTLFVIVGGIAAIRGLVFGLLTRSVLSIFAGIFIFPVTAVAVGAVGTMLFYYLFKFFYKKDVPIKTLYEVLFMASLPGLIIGTFSPLFMPLALVSVAFWGVLAVIGLAHVFQVPRDSLAKWIGGVVAVYALMWIVNAVNLQKSREALHNLASPESLDILEREMRNQ